MDQITRIKPYRKENAAAYQNFVMQHPNSLIYHTDSYMALLKRHLDCDFHYYILERGSSVGAVLTGMSKNGRYGKVLNSLPFFGSNGGILAADDCAYDLMLEHYNELSNDMSFATFIENPFEIMKRKPHFNFTSQRVCQVTDTSDLDLEKLDGIFTSKKRNDIRRAMRNQIHIDVDSSDHAKAYLIDTHITNMKTIDAANKSRDYFYDLFSSFRARIDYDLLTARKDGELVAALLLLYHKNMVEYYTPVISAHQRHLQALSLIIYEAMRINKLLGRTVWNWGGNGNSLGSVYRFKKNWGALDYPYNYFVKSNHQSHNSLDYKNIFDEYKGFYLLPFEQICNPNRETEVVEIK